MPPQALLAWLAIVPLAIANGLLREKLLVPAVGVVAGNLLSGTILSMLIVLVAVAGTSWYGLSAPWTIGAAWLVLTLAFEFAFGRLVAHKTWSELFAAYTFKDGNIWPLVLAVILAAPWIATRMRGLS